jgi:arylsulfatase A-like enzyme
MKKYFLLIVISILLAACADISALQGITAHASETPTLGLPPTQSATQTPPPTVTASPTSTPPTYAIRRVLIISIDGLRPDAIDLAPMPYLLSLMLKSAYSLSAQTVQPSITLPAHTSMLTGLCVLKHNVRWNEYIPQNGYAIGTDLFDLAHAAGYKTAMYVGKEKLRQITEPQSTDIFLSVDISDDILISRLLSDFPQDFGLMFVHLADVDIAGHDTRWLSQTQLDAAYIADQEINRLLNALGKYNLRNETLVIITADHGGNGENHVQNIPENRTIPWIVFGPGVQPKKLTTRIHITDTAATAAYALGLQIPKEWDGIPVYEAFGLPAQPHTEPVCP